MPQIIAVSLFLLCLLAAGMGLILMVHGYRHTRRRLQTHRHPYEDMYPIEHP